MRDWEAIEADYATGAYTLRDIAEKHNISHTAVAKRAKQHSWIIIDSKEVKAMVDANVVYKDGLQRFTEFTKLPEAIEDLTDIQLTQKRVASKLFSKIEQMVDEVAEFRDVKDLATAFAQTSSPFKDDRTQIAIQNNNEVSAITRKVID